MFLVRGERTQACYCKAVTPRKLWITSAVQRSLRSYVLQTSTSALQS